VPKFGRRAIMVLATVTHAIFFVILLILPDNNAEYVRGVRYHLCVSYARGGRSTGAYLYYFGLSICFAVGDSVWESFPPAILQNPAMFRVRGVRTRMIMRHSSLMCVCAPL
jgi:hypothetical protein